MPGRFGPRRQSLLLEHVPGGCGLRPGRMVFAIRHTFGPTCLRGIDFGSIGYFCHTPADECIDDQDCTGTTDSCVFNVGALHWVCMAKVCTH